MSDSNETSQLLISTRQELDLLRRWSRLSREVGSEVLDWDALVAHWRDIIAHHGGQVDAG